MRTKDTTVAVLSDRLSDALIDVTAAHIGVIVSIADDGRPEVRLEPDGPAVPCRLAISVTRERIEAAIAQGQPAVLLFERGDQTKPLIVGFIEVLQPTAPATPAPVTDKPPIVEADVDGRRVRVTAQDEIVLECGSASVTLRRNGRVIIRGTYVETRADGTNRIKGGQVQIN